MFGGIGNVGNELGRALAHGLSQSTISAFTGGDSFSSFLSAGLGSLAGSGFMSTKFGKSVEGMYVFSGFAGGVGAELAGGDFLQGASLGLMNAGLNHAKQGFSGENTKEDKSESTVVEEPSQYELFKAARDGRTLYVSDGKGNFTYYRPDGSIEISTVSPKMEILQDITLVLMPELKGVGVIGRLKVPFFEGLGKRISKYAPKLNSGKGLRIGLSKSRGRRVFRVTSGSGKRNHLLDIDLGPIPNYKKK
jgi:hypothetical protein